MDDLFVYIVIVIMFAIDTTYRVTTKQLRVVEIICMWVIGIVLLLAISQKLGVIAGQLGNAV